MNALIICDGERPHGDLLRRMADEADLVIATDGAAAWAATAGVRPHVVVGDFDSLPAPDGDWEIVDAGPHEQQDNSDAEKAVLLALARNASRIAILGATGRRLDHTLANVWLAARYHQQADIVLMDDYSECRIVSDELRLATTPGTVISLVPLTLDVTLRTGGLRWPLDGPLAPGTLGLSNQAAGEEVTVEVRSGLVAFIVVPAPAAASEWATKCPGDVPCPA
ncbi:MAG: thiamine diphosphokinase [Armatimonadetes bacterium]|nr:thiamine diphosphokinase [Armatimonadota bacterium]